MTENRKSEAPKKIKKICLRHLRISLKYRPEILKLILKMRSTMHRKTVLITHLKHQIKLLTKLSSEAANDIIESLNFSESTQIDVKPSCKDSYTQTVEIKELQKTEDRKGWKTDIESGEKEKSIADQVKEVAQSVVQQSGMVYVESAGMYYDYKTGYYYNSELGLYYHTDTGCYYYYSDDKQSFVFHSYPDRSKVNAALEAHEKKKARKQKKDKKNEDDVENLTKNFSQDKEESNDATKPKRRKVSKKKQDDTTTVTTDDNKTVDKLESKIDEETDIFPIEEKKEEKIAKKKSSEDLEDGECSETESEQSNEEGEEEMESDGSTSTATDDESVAKHHPPCMRVIVRETNLPKLKVGSLFLVTKDGGTVGREGDQHTIIIRDHNVSRNHLDIKYDETKRMYVAVDLGSKNGTMLNGIRMSESQICSEPLEVMHGSTIQLGETKLLCHIHPGNDTCGHCEPGLLMEDHDKEKTVAYTRTCSVQKQHQLELARLKNKYAPQPLAIEETAYNDRAQVRRETVGSSHHSEKTQTSDVDTFITPENKGFKLLEKMGWSKGEGLGKDNQGETEPVPLVSNEGKSGLGAPNLPTAPKNVNPLGSATIRLASRSKLLQPPAKAFQNVLDEDSDE